MEFQWDEEKRLKNIEKHGIDFIDADILFDNPYLVSPGKTVDGEARLLAIGMIDEVYVTAFSPDAGRSSASSQCGEHGMEKEEKHQAVFERLTWKQRRARGESRTDSACVQAKTAEELERDIASDTRF